jgi:hypothetical protein
MPYIASRPSAPGSSSRTTRCSHHPGRPGGPSRPSLPRLSLRPPGLLRICHLRPAGRAHLPRSGLPSRALVSLASRGPVLQAVFAPTSRPHLPPPRPACGSWWPSESGQKKEEESPHGRPLPNLVSFVMYDCNQISGLRVSKPIAQSASSHLRRVLCWQFGCKRGGSKEVLACDH